MVLPEGWK